MNSSQAQIKILFAGFAMALLLTLQARQSHVEIAFGLRIASSVWKSTGCGGQCWFSARRSVAWWDRRNLYNGILQM